MQKRGPGRPAGADPHLSLSDRQEAIIACLAGESYVDVGHLTERFGVTPQTIRRDLRRLEQSGRLARFHGGVAALASSTENIGYVERQAIHRAEKQRIAAAVAGIIPDGASLFINIGTTTEAVADALVQHQRLRIITNNLNVAMRLIRRTGTEVTVAGGPVRNSDGAVIGGEAAEFIDRFPGRFRRDRHQRHRPG